MRPAWLAIRSAPLGLKQYTHMWASACICTWPKIILTPGGKIEQDTLHANQTTPWGDHGKDYTGWSCPKLADQESGLKLARLGSHWSGSCSLESWVMLACPNYSCCTKFEMAFSTQLQFNKSVMIWQYIQDFTDHVTEIKSQPPKHTALTNTVIHLEYQMCLLFTVFPLPKSTDCSKENSQSTEQFDSYTHSHTLAYSQA